MVIGSCFVRGIVCPFNATEPNIGLNATVIIPRSFIGSQKPTERPKLGRNFAVEAAVAKPIIYQGPSLFLFPACGYPDICRTISPYLGTANTLMWWARKSPLLSFRSCASPGLHQNLLIRELAESPGKLMFARGELYKKIPGSFKGK